MSKFHERLKELGFQSYDAYLDSDIWKAFKEKYRRSDRPMRCAVCSAKKIQLHHQSYVRLGREELNDVVPVCRPHHTAIHDYLKSSGLKFVRFTAKAIKHLRKTENHTKPKKKKEGKKKVRQQIRERKAAEWRTRFAHLVEQLETLMLEGFARRKAVHGAIKNRSEKTIIDMIRAAERRKAEKRKLGTPVGHDGRGVTLVFKKTPEFISTGVKVEPLVNAKAQPDLSNWRSFLKKRHE